MRDSDIIYLQWWCLSYFLEELVSRTLSGLHCKALIVKGVFVLYNVLPSIADTMDKASNVRLTPHAHGSQKGIVLVQIYSMYDSWRTEGDDSSTPRL